MCSLWRKKRPVIVSPGSWQWGMKAAGMCGLDQKYSPFIYHLFVASPSTDVPSGLNASGNTAPPADTGPPPRFFIGLSLTLGFTLMFVVDQIGNYFSSKGKMATLSWYIIPESHLYIHVYVRYFLIHMSHYRPREQCRYYGHGGTGDPCSRCCVTVSC